MFGPFSVLSSPYRLHAGLIYLFMDFLWSASMFSLRPVFQGLALRFILCFSHAVTFILTPISRYIPPPIRLPFLFVLYHFPCMVFSWPFVYLRLLPPSLSSLSFVFSLFFPFDAFSNCLKWLVVVYRCFCRRFTCFFVIYLITSKVPIFPRCELLVNSRQTINPE